MGSKVQRRILCYRRPWLVEHTKLLVKKAFPNADVKYITDFLGLEGEELQLGIIERMNNCKRLGDNYLLDTEYREIRLRCRLLRELGEEEARNLCNAVWETVKQIFDDYCPEVVIGKPVDSYVLDILARYCKAKDIPYYSTIASFINGYQRITRYGEFNKVREPELEECENVLVELLKNDYTPNFMDFQETRNKTIIKGWKNQIKKILRLVYNYYKYRCIDKYNYHYWANWKVELKRVDCWPHQYAGDINWRKKLEIMKKNKKIVFIPLQFTPEATVDYYCPNVNVIDYQKTLMLVLDEFAKNNIIAIVKEHPGVVGMRKWKHYKQIKNHNNVVMPPPYIRGSELINMADMVFVWTGTIGVEAALRGKPVIHIGEPYYIAGDMFFSADPNSNLSKVIQRVLALENRAVRTSAQLKIIKHNLSTCIKSVPREVDPKGGDCHSVAYKEELEITAKLLRQYFN